MKQCRNTRAELLLSVTGSTDIISTHLQLFELFSPKAFIREFVIPQTKKTMTEGGQVLTYVELLVWIRLWLMMSTIQGFQCRGFWSSSTIDPIETAPYRFNGILPWTLFEEILNALTITNETQPAYKYLVLEARHLVDEWNHNTDTKFSPRYISCLDESMMKWVNKYTCPGFMFVPHKPWPFGN